MSPPEAPPRARPQAGVLWITGLPASGKSTLASHVAATLNERGASSSLVDSDEVRLHLTPEASYSEEERRIVYRSIAYAARRLSLAGTVAVVAATAHAEALRQEAERICGPIFWVWAKAPLATCEARDPKGLYEEARRDPHSTLPGVGAPFEAPPGAYEVDTSGRLGAEDLDHLAAAFLEWRG